jgi:hypothetical protein
MTLDELFKRREQEIRPDWFQQGKDAALANEPREAPEELSDDEADIWLAGWDSEGQDDEA